METFTQDAASLDQVFEMVNSQPQPDYSPIPDGNEAREPKSFDSDESGLRKAARELTRRGDESPDSAAQAPQESENITKCPYIWDGGAKDGERIEETRTVSAEKAARDLTNTRNAEASFMGDQSAQADAQVVDALRNAFNPQPQTPQVPEQPVVEAQPEYVHLQPSQGLHPDLAKALESPVVRQALEETMAEVSKAQKQYAEIAASTAYAGLSAMLHQFPELRGLNGQQLDVAVQLIQRQNPVRAAEISAHLQATSGTMPRWRSSCIQPRSRENDQLFSSSVSGRRTCFCFSRNW
jgi:hypothetical protein